jgi:orotate phosphoribosyltransferase
MNTDNKDIARTSARILLDSESVLFSTDPPFTLTSGRIAPVYIDCRRLISFPEERSLLMHYATQMLTERCGDTGIDMVAGGETAGIPYAAFIAERLNKPMVYVRKTPKGVGRMAQIEGCMEREGQNVVLVEDLQTDGGSKKGFVDALRTAGARVTDSFVIFHYDIFPQSRQNMKNWDLRLHSLTSWWDVLAVARHDNYFDEATLAEVEAFLNAPENWGRQQADSSQS